MRTGLILHQRIKLCKLLFGVNDKKNGFKKYSEVEIYKMLDKWIKVA